MPVGVSDPHRGKCQVVVVGTAVGTSQLMRSGMVVQSQMKPVPGFGRRGESANFRVPRLGCQRNQRQHIHSGIGRTVVLPRRTVQTGVMAPALQFFQP